MGQYEIFVATGDSNFALAGDWSAATLQGRIVGADTPVAVTVGAWDAESQTTALHLDLTDAPEAAEIKILAGIEILGTIIV